MQLGVKDSLFWLSGCKSNFPLFGICVISDLDLQNILFSLVQPKKDVGARIILPHFLLLFFCDSEIHKARGCSACHGP